MRLLQDLHIFLSTARLGNLTLVAKQLNLTPAATSAAIKRLEQQLGAELFVRSTRSLRLTQAGELFLSHCQPGVEQIELGMQLVQQGREQLCGELRLAMPSDLGRNLLLDWLDQFNQLHPGLSLRLSVTDRMTDLYKEPLDAAIRYGQPADSGMVALALSGSNHRVLCAAPSYLERYGAPAAPADLSQHHCLRFALKDSTHSNWTFYRQQQTETVVIQGGSVADDGDVVRRWLVSGRGIGFKSLLDVSEDILAGRLVPMCTDWQGEAAPLHLLVPGRSQLTPVIQALRQFLSERLQQQLQLVLELIAASGTVDR